MTLQLARRTRHTSFPKSYRSLIKVIHDIISCNYRSDGNHNCQHFFQIEWIVESEGFLIFLSLTSLFWAIRVWWDTRFIHRSKTFLLNGISNVKTGCFIFLHKKVRRATTWIWICMYIVMPRCTFFFNMKTVHTVFSTSHLLKVEVFSI